MSKNRMAALFATATMMTGTLLGIASPAQAATPCATTLSYYFLGGGREGAQWVTDAYLIASDSRSCKYHGTKWTYAGGITWNDGGYNFSIPR